MKQKLENPFKALHNHPNGDAKKCTGCKPIDLAVQKRSALFDLSFLDEPAEPLPASTFLEPENAWDEEFLVKLKRLEAAASKAAKGEDQTSGFSPLGRQSYVEGGARDIQPRNGQRGSTNTYILPPTVPDKVAVGIKDLDVENSTPIAVGAYVGTTSSNDFEVHLDAFDNCALWSGNTTWLRMRGDDPNLQTGFLQSDHEGWTADVKFARPYPADAAAPKVVLWVNGVKMNNKQDWRLQAQATDVTPTGFRLQMSSGQEGVDPPTWLCCTWISHPADMPGFLSATFTTQSVHPPEAPQAETRIPVTFEKPFVTGPPTIFCGWNQFSQDCVGNLRLNISWEEVTKEGAVFVAKSWDDTVFRGLGGAFVALERAKESENGAITANGSSPASTAAGVPTPSTLLPGGSGIDASQGSLSLNGTAGSAHAGASKKVLVACDGSLGCSLTQDYDGILFKQRAVDPSIRKFGETKSAEDLAPKSHTNIWRFCTGLADTDRDGSPQECQYFPGGIGLSNLDSAWALTGDPVVRFCLLMTGLECRSRITEVYHYLCTTFQEGMEISFAGYGRGAFTARTVANMVSLYGLMVKKTGQTDDDLKKDCDSLRAWHFQEIFKTARPNEGMPAYPGLSGTTSQGPEGFQFVRNFTLGGEFMWDTIGPLGQPVLSINKGLWPAIPLLKTLTDKLFASLDLDYDRPTTFEFLSADQSLPIGIRKGFHALGLGESAVPMRPYLWADSDRIEQCWFAGDHLDIGGGVFYDRQAADITLAWMVQKAEDNNLLHFKDDFIARAAISSFCLRGKNPSAASKKSLEPYGLGMTHNAYNQVEKQIGTYVGSHQRTPGAYLKLDAKAGKTRDTIAKTNESIHRTVRIRLDSPKGHGANGNRDFAPRALENWTRPPGDHDPRYECALSRFTKPTNTPDHLSEAQLGSYEAKMKAYYDDITKAYQDLGLPVGSELEAGYATP